MIFFELFDRKINILGTMIKKFLLLLLKIHFSLIDNNNNNDFSKSNYYDFKSYSVTYWVNYKIYYEIFYSTKI